MVKAGFAVELRWTIIDFQPLLSTFHSHTQHRFHLHKIAIGNKKYGTEKVVEEYCAIT